MSNNYIKLCKKCEEIVEAIVKDGTANTENGSWVVYFDEFGENEHFKFDKQFVFDHKDLIFSTLATRVEISDVELREDCFDCCFWLDYCPSAQEFEKNL